MTCLQLSVPAKLLTCSGVESGVDAVVHQIWPAVQALIRLLKPCDCVVRGICVPNYGAAQRGQV